MDEIEAGSIAKDSMNVARTAMEKTIAVNKAIDECCVDGDIIGTGQADYTHDSTEYNMKVNGKDFSLIDVPGIEGDESKYMDIIQKALEKAHVVFYVNGSGKKPESKTVEKIKSYLRHDTSVYALINVHCQPIKSRDVEIDGYYSDNLNKVYNEANRVAEQSKEQLIPILGEHYKDSKCLNGLLAFYALAVDSDTGRTTVVPDTGAKALREEQISYYNDCDKSIDKMLELSQIDGIKDIIQYQSGHFKGIIIGENIKKLRRSIVDTIEQVEILKEGIHQKLSDYETSYDDSYRECCEAKDIYVNNMLNVGYSIVDECFEETKTKVYNFIEYNDGKVKPREIGEVIEEDEHAIEGRLSSALDEKGAQYKAEFEAAIAKAQKNLLQDIERANKNFTFNIESRAQGLSHVMDSMKLNKKDFGSSLLKVGSFAAAGFALGSVIPGLGNILGAIVGAIVGAIASFISIFMSRQKRIEKAQEKARGILNDLKRRVASEIRDKIQNSDVISGANGVVDNWKRFADEQKASFNIVRSTLDNVIATLNAKVKSIDGGEYGTID